MDIKTLLDQLQSLSPEKQIESLKAMKKSATQKELKLIELSAEAAGSPWLKSALLDIVNSNNVETKNIEPVLNSEETFDVDAVKSSAVSDSIGQVLHELEPIIGSINVFAEREIDDFSSSKTREELEKLNETLETFEDWRKVEQSPRYREINILEVISKEVERIKPKSHVNIDVQLSEDLVYVISPSLLRIIISNGLRNAVESSNQPTLREKHPIVIKGGSTNESMWICIIDDGLGLQSKSEILLKSRHTTKPGNRGLGLAIIEKAVTSMAGDWKLSNSKPYGAELYVEIPKRDLN